jgi:ABC-type taurine transport system ATPase subunit
MISVAGVAYAYGSGRAARPALADISLDVAPREFVGIIGANGTGKSTLLKIIAGLIPPMRGTITIDSRSVDGPDRRVGLVFQEPRLLPWRSTLDNVAFPLERAGIARGVREGRATTAPTLGWDATAGGDCPGARARARRAASR